MQYPPGSQHPPQVPDQAMHLAGQLRSGQPDKNRGRVHGSGLRAVEGLLAGCRIRAGSVWQLPKPLITTRHEHSGLLAHLVKCAGACASPGAGPCWSRLPLAALPPSTQVPDHVSSSTLMSCHRCRQGCCTAWPRPLAGNMSNHLPHSLTPLSEGLVAAVLPAGVNMLTIWRGRRLRRCTA